MINKQFLNKEFDKYLERPFIFLDFFIFVILLLPFLFTFSEPTLHVFHFLDLTIWLLILGEVIFKLWVEKSKIEYLEHNWEDVLVAVLPVLPNFKIFSELRHIHINQIREGLRAIRLAAFVKRIDRRLKLIMIGRFQ